MALNGLMNIGPRAGDPAAREVPAGQPVAQAPGARALRAVPELLAEGARDRDAHREGRVAAGPAAQGDPEPRRVRRPARAARCSRRSTRRARDASVKKAVLQAFMVVGREGPRARGGPRARRTPALRRQADPAAGRDGRARRASGRCTSPRPSPRPRRRCCRRWRVGGDSDRLRRGGAQRQGRRDAPRGHARCSGPSAGRPRAGAIVEIYKAESDPPHAGGGARRALRLGQRPGADRDREDREGPRAQEEGRVSHLANMHSKEATAFLLEILNK